MTAPNWTPVLGDIGTPGSANALALETAAREAADAVLAAAIANIPPAGVSSVFARTGAVVKQAGDYNFSDLGGIPNSIAGYGITDFNSLGDARWLLINNTAQSITSILASGAPKGSNLVYTWTPSATANTSSTAIAATALIDGSADVSGGSGFLIGLWSTAATATTRTGPTTSVAALRLLSSKQNAVGDVSFLMGQYSQVDHHAGHVTDAEGIYIFQHHYNTSTTDRLIGIHVDVTQIDTGATVTSRYGLLIEGTQVGAGVVTNDWGIYVGGTVKSHFGGAVDAASFAGDGSLLTNLNAYTKTLSDSRFLRDIPILGSDTFPQAASTALSTLATGQTWVMWNGAWVATGANQAKENASVRDAAVVWDTGLTEQDWAVYVTTNSPNVGAQGVICRGVSAGNYIFTKWTAGNLTINKMVAGVATQLATIAGAQVSNPVYKMRVTATGNVITVKVDGPTFTPGLTLSFTLTGSDATFFVGTFVGMYLTATSGTNAGYLFSNVAFRNYLNAQVTLDARYLRLDEIGQTIAPNAPSAGVITVIGLNIGQQNNQSALKVWGQILLGNNNDNFLNSTGSGFLHMGSNTGVTLGLTNGTVHLKAVAAGISSPVAPFIQTSGGAPALASSAGVVGQLGWDSGNLYICVAANTWKRVAVATF